MDPPMAVISTLQKLIIIFESNNALKPNNAKSPTMEFKIRIKIFLKNLNSKMIDRIMIIKTASSVIMDTIKIVKYKYFSQSLHDSFFNPFKDIKRNL
ncbi:MAG: hypothetical protein ABH828_00375 [archaeon]